MSLTKEAERRFWLAMVERFGKRWVDDYGETASAAWIELLGGYTPLEIKAALDLMSGKGLVHPPTLPMFKGYLVEARRSSKKADVDYVRAFWRSSIVTHCSDFFGFRRQDTRDGVGFEQLLTRHRLTLGEELRRLLDELHTSEIDTGQRVDGMHKHCIAQCWRIYMQYKDLAVKPYSP